QQSSPTIDQGYAGKRKTDQRGRKRPFQEPSTPRPASGDGSDIGAFEVSPVSRQVTQLGDSGPGSLRQTISDASSPDNEPVCFADHLAATITLTTGTLELSKNTTIQGPGASVISVSGNNLTTVLHVPSGVSASISGVRIMNGRTSSYGAGVLDEGSLTLT